MTKAELLRDYAELNQRHQYCQMNYDDLWLKKEKYKKLWQDSDERMVALHDDLKQLLEGIK